MLLIPLAMITGVLRERLQRRNEAVTDITSSWGGEQNVIGPVLGIPYQYKFKVVKEVPAPDGKMERREVEENGTAIAYFLPETLLSQVTWRRRCYIAASTMPQFFARRLRSRASLRRRISGRSRST